jgi:hypothetical protein
MQIVSGSNSAKAYTLLPHTGQKQVSIQRPAAEILRHVVQRPLVRWIADLAQYPWW